MLAPGAYQHYSNLAFSLLGEVVARVTGLDYERYVDERVLRPLGLERTSWKPKAPVAAGYFVDPWTDEAVAEPVAEGRATASAGELWSTASDLCRWAAFLADPDPQVLSRDTVEEMHAFQTMADLEHWTVGYGLALMLMRKGDRLFSGHSGAHLGFLSNVACHRPSRTGAAVLTNSSAGVAITTLGVDLADTRRRGLPGGSRGVGSPASRRRTSSSACSAPGGRRAPSTSSATARAGWRRSCGRRHAGARPHTLRAGGRGPLPRRIGSRARRAAGRIVRDRDGEVVRLEFATYPFTRGPEPMASA